MLVGWVSAENYDASSTTTNEFFKRVLVCDKEHFKSIKDTKMPPSIRNRDSCIIPTFRIRFDFP